MRLTIKSDIYHPLIELACWGIVPYSWRQHIRWSWDHDFRRGKDWEGIL